MERRDWFRWMGGSLALPVLSGLTPDEALALARSIHTHITERSTRGTLDPQQFATVEAITECIIPETDTPGARSARVAAFIDLLLTEWYDEPDRQRLLEGLTHIDARSRARHGRPFIELAPEEQQSLLSELDAEVQALRESQLRVDDHYFQQLKWLTLYGYYTSEAGVTQELKWVPIPAGGYDPCRAFVPRPAGGV